MAVRTYYSDDPEAPVLTGEPGTLVNLLKKCLVDGYGDVGQGTWKAPLGWEAVYNTAYTRGGFRATAPGATGFWLEFNDTGASASGYRLAQTYGWEGLTGYDGDGLPVGTQQIWSGTVSMFKSSDANGTARNWVLIGDDLLWYLFVEYHGSYQGHFALHAFGDVISYRAGDAYHCAVIGSGNVTIAAPSVSCLGYLLGRYSDSQSGHYLFRRYTGLAGLVQFGKLGDNLTGASSVAMGTSGYAFPSPVDNGLHLAPIRVVESSFLRGVLPGVYQPLHDRPIAHRDVLVDVDGLPGRTLQAISLGVAATSGDAGTGRILVDLTGPWR